jgi:uncharacterized protein YjdB
MFAVGCSKDDDDGVVDDIAKLPDGVGVSAADGIGGLTKGNDIVSTTIPANATFDDEVVQEFFDLYLQAIRSVSITTRSAKLRTTSSGSSIFYGEYGAVRVKYEAGGNIETDRYSYVSFTNEFFDFSNVDNLFLGGSVGYFNSEVKNQSGGINTTEQADGKIRFAGKFRGEIIFDNIVRSQGKKVSGKFQLKSGDVTIELPDSLMREFVYYPKPEEIEEILNDTVPKFVAVNSINIDIPGQARVGETLNLLPSVVPFEATNRRITWKVENAIIDSFGRVITFDKAGTAKITATITNGKSAAENFTQTWEVKVIGNDVVVPVEEQWTVTLIAEHWSDDGKLLASYKMEMKVNKDSTINLPTSWSLEDKPGTITEWKMRTVTGDISLKSPFKPEADVTIYGTWEAEQWTVTLIAECQKLLISDTVEMKVNKGSSINLPISWTLNGNPGIITAWNVRMGYGDIPVPNLLKPNADVTLYGIWLESLDLLRGTWIYGDPYAIPPTTTAWFPMYFGQTPKSGDPILDEPAELELANVKNITIAEQNVSWTMETRNYVQYPESHPCWKPAGSPYWGEWSGYYSHASMNIFFAGPTVGYYLTENFEITVSYESDTDINLVLTDKHEFAGQYNCFITDRLETSFSTGTAYRVRMGAGAHTVTFKKSDFRQPNTGAPDYMMPDYLYALNLNKVESLSFAAIATNGEPSDAPGSIVKMTNVRITQLMVKGVEWRY